MSLPAALAFVALAALLGNRILSILTGLLLKIPAIWLIGTVVSLDLVQIPFYYWIYENGAALVERLPALLKGWALYLRRMRPQKSWAQSMGAAGIFLVALLPSFGGGIWTAVLLAHALKIHKATSAGLMAVASIVSCLGLYWVLGTLVSTIKYFSL